MNGYITKPVHYCINTGCNKKTRGKGFYECDTCECKWSKKQIIKMKENDPKVEAAQERNREYERRRYLKTKEEK